MSTSFTKNVVCSGHTLLRAPRSILTRPRLLRAVATLSLLPLAATAWAVSSPAPSLDQLQKKMAGMAVPFEANQGEFAPEVAFAARTFAGMLFVTKDGRIVHALLGKPDQQREAQKNDESTAGDNTPRGHISKSSTPRGPGWALVETLHGADELMPIGSQPSATHVSRFGGGAAPNQTSNIATFDRVRIGDAWPGVSVELAARGNNVEKLFTVAPGTNPKTIQMGVAGAKRLRLGEDGSLIATTGNGDVAFTPPVAFQEIHGQRSDVPVKYRLLADNSYRFDIAGSYDHGQPLVIDPLLQTTYVGGSGDDQANALAVDAAGNVLIAGSTTSVNFPGTAGGAQPANSGGGNSDAFVARLSSNLTTLVQATYLGGSGNDGATSIALDASGNVLIAGSTKSVNFPGTAGGAQAASGGGQEDAFVARLSSNLTTLVQTTYIGGNGLDDAFALALDTGGNVLVAGTTNSTNFPGTGGAAQSANGGGVYDGFVALLSSNLSTLVRATYVGGSGEDQAIVLLPEASGSVLVAGFTASTNFPGTTGGAQPATGSSNDYDAFVARLSGNLTTLVQATYLGGSLVDEADALALDTAGNVLVEGITSSTNFPATAGGAQPAIGGGYDAFVARLSGNLKTLAQATYVGGNGSDFGRGVALDAAGNVLVAGFTDSTNLPGTTGGAQPANGGSYDGFVARLSSNLATLEKATYLGGADYERVTAIALDPAGNVFITGYTASTNLPGSAGGAQAGNGGGNDAFVAKLTLDLRSDPIFSNGFE